ncbi:MAG TPA: dehydrogenase, partial [Phenylobacterium sp.]
MTPSRSRLVAAVLIALIGVGGCSTIDKINPFKGKGPAQESATEGERISIIAADQKLEPAEALKGVDFALPPAQPIADWPLPGGDAEQAM